MPRTSSSEILPGRRSCVFFVLLCCPCFLFVLIGIPSKLPGGSFRIPPLFSFFYCLCFGFRRDFFLRKWRTVQ